MIWMKLYNYYITFIYVLIGSYTLQSAALATSTVMYTDLSSGKIALQAVWLYIRF